MAQPLGAPEDIFFTFRSNLPGSRHEMVKQNGMVQKVVVWGNSFDRWGVPQMRIGGVRCMG